MKHKFLLLPVLIICLTACKNDAVVPQSAAAIEGKWFITKHTLKLMSGGVQISADSSSTYTKDDFIEYFTNGSGVISVNPYTGSPIVTIFKYTVKGNIITQTNDVGSDAVETITRLTATEFAIHYETMIRDPKNQNQVDNEVDDYEFAR